MNTRMRTWIIIMTGWLAASGAWAADANGTWTQATSGGLWKNTANWSGGTVATGTTATANFNTLNITADNTVRLDAPWTINSLTFGDTVTSSPAGWVLDNNGSGANVLTLGGTTPTITVNALGSGKDVNISASIAGTAGFTKSGAGQLTLSGSSGNSYTGLTTVNAGRLHLNKSSGLAIGGDLTVTNAFVTFVSGAANNQIASTAALVMSGANSVFNGTSITGDIASYVTQTVSSVQVTDGIFHAGGLSLWTVTGAASFSQGATYQGNSGHTASFGSLSLSGMTNTDVNGLNGFHLYGNQTTKTTVTVGSGGLTLDNSVISLRKGPTTAGALGSRLVLDGNVTTTGSGASAIVE